MQGILKELYVTLCILYIYIYIYVIHIYIYIMYMYMALKMLCKAEYCPLKVYIRLRALQRAI